MGQHKYNPNCQLAKDGKLETKEPKLSKRECERRLRASVQQYLFQRTGLDFFNFQNY